MRISRWFTVAVVLIAALSLVGCAQKKAGEDSASASKASSEAGTSEQSASATTPAAIWAQIQATQDSLSAAVDGGQMQDVHHLAFKVRDLVVYFQQQVTGLSDTDAAALNHAVNGVGDAANTLAGQADTGNADGVKTGYDALSKLLDSIKTVTMGQ